MLTNKRFTIVSDSTVNDEKIASFGAIINVDTGELSFTSRYINDEACKEYREVVRNDRTSFEDFAYSIQDMMAKDQEVPQ